MSLTGCNPEAGSEISGNSSQIAYQWDRSAVGADIECKLDDDMLSYFAQASFDIFMGYSGPGSASITGEEIYRANVMSPGACY